jgi:uncharacterized protein DUF4231
MRLALVHRLKKLQKPALVRRLPKVFWRGNPSDGPLRDPDRVTYGELAGDFDLLDGLLVPTFRTYDEDALEAQNRFRRQQVLLIGGSAVATILGVLQAASIDGSAFGWTEAVLAGLLAPVAARTGSAHKAFLANRLKAERLRGEYFAFLARSGDYADKTTDKELSDTLRSAVDAIDASE